MLGKTIAALLICPFLAILVLGLIAVLSPDQRRDTLPILMLFVPAWVALITLTFTFGSGAKAWFWMGSFTFISLILLYTLKTLKFVGVEA